MCGTDTAIVVRFAESCFHFVRSQFSFRGFSHEDVTKKVRCKSLWNGLVDGNFRHQAIISFIHINRLWKAFEWMVTVVQADFSKVQYRQLAKRRNMRHAPDFFVQITFADILFNLLLKYTRLQLKECLVTVSMGFGAYTGNGKYSKSSIKQTAQTTMRVPIAVIETFRAIPYEENPEVCLHNDGLYKRGLKSVEEFVKYVHC